jgi:hypothetical protein
MILLSRQTGPTAGQVSRSVVPELLRKKTPEAKVRAVRQDHHDTAHLTGMELALTKAGELFA